MRQNPIQRTVKNCSLKYANDCAQLEYTTHTAQNSSDNLPSYLQTITGRAELIREQLTEYIELNNITHALNINQSVILSLT